MRGPVHLKRVSLETTIVCTRAAPFKPSMGKPGILVLHPDQIETERPHISWPTTTVVERRCPTCGFDWPPELRSAKA